MPLTVHTGGKWRTVPNGRLAVHAGRTWRKARQGWVHIGGRWRTFYQGTDPQTHSYYATAAESYNSTSSGGPWAHNTRSDRPGFLHEGYGSFSKKYEAGLAVFDQKSIAAFLNTRRKATRIVIRLSCLWTYAGAGKTFHVYEGKYGPGIPSSVVRGPALGNIAMTRGSTRSLTLTGSAAQAFADHLRTGSAHGLLISYGGSSSSSYWGFLVGIKTATISHGSKTHIRSASTSIRPAITITADY